MTEHGRYSEDLSIFDSLRAVIPKFRSNRAYLRASEPLTPAIQRELGATAPRVTANRDRAVCALVNKACNTHAAIRLLTDAGHGDDAMALGRVLLENTTILKWLLLDPIYRLDLYCISDALYRRRWCELVVEHFQERPDLVAQAQASLDDEVRAVAGFFGDTIHRWAKILHPDGKLERVNFEKMMEEVGTSGGSSSSFQHDVIYFLHSAFVHSTASSMRSFSQLRREMYFGADLGPNSHRRSEALGGANISLIQVLSAAADYLGLADIETELDELFEKMKGAQRDETPEVHDSPRGSAFPELSAAGGFFLIEAESDADAAALARTCPHVKYGGSVVVRRVIP
jgi:hypothetical protein